MVIHRGTHGTCYEWACQILAEGFKPSSMGRAGPGVYFWTYEEDPEMARTLALGWVQAANKRSVYQPVKPSKCSVIYTEFKAPADECLDCDTRTFEESLNRFLQKMATIGDEDLDTAYQTLITNLEQTLEVKYKLIQTRVSLPRGIAFKQKIFIGNPAIHVIRTGHESDISVTNCETMPMAVEAVVQ